MAEFDFGNMFGGGMQGGTPTGLDALFNEDQRKLMNRNAALSAAAALLQASGRSTTPIGLGQALGSALQAGQQGYQQARAGSVQDLLLNQKLEEAKRLGLYQTALAGIPPTAAPAQPAQPLEPLTPAQASLMSQTTPVSTAGPAQIKPPAPAQPSEADQRFQELMRKADIANRFNKPDDAQKFLDQAYKIKPVEEYSTTPQFGTSAGGTPISFVLSKSGSMKLFDFNRSPEFNYQDTGSYISVRDKNTNKELERIPKSMTPGEIASNRISQSRLNLSQAEFNRGGYQLKEGPDGLSYVPTAPGGPAIPVLTAAGTPFEGAGAKPTEDQSKSAGFAFRMKQSTEVFNQPITGKDGQPVIDPATGKPVTLEQAYGQPNRYQAIMRAIPSAGLTTGIANVSEDVGRQQYRQAQENWVTANLRPESGAAIGVDEMAKEITKYFPQANDKPETIDQKARARRDTELAMTVRAGPAYKQVEKAVAARQQPGVARLVRDPVTGVLRYVTE